ncbi:MAG TPA: IPT/TIG domain-containing protein [Candidatus Acidoferrales bacterium]|nr:IPT/TIG domain-containing protein [Candidatus Acidoferrales bacterium]
MRRLFPLFVLVAALLQADCAGVTGTSGNPGNPGASPPPPSISVSVSPNPATVRVGATQSFSATVTDTSNSNVTWQVNGVAGGSAATGTISSSGLYTAPAALPNPNSVTVQAVSAADSSASGSSTVTLWNPMPVLNGISPNTVSTGAFSITLNGSGFVSGAQAQLAGTALTTSFVSSTQLTATGNASTAGNFAVTVTNPNPGSATSGAQNLQVTSNSGGPPPPPPACSVMTPGQEGSLNGFVLFPPDNLWNTDISNSPVDPNSAAIISFIGGSVPLHPDFGSGLYNGSIIGIPYLVVDSSQAPIAIDFTAYGDESDPGPMPIPTSAPIEGDPNPSGDQHVLVLDNNGCWLYELFDAQPSGAGWNAGSAAVWDLTADEQRPYTWTSADAAGLPIFPGLVRYDEVVAGAINHAIRFTLQHSRAAFTPPASHWAANSSSANAAPMGMRMRLKASFDISGYSATNQVILTAMKKYGIIMADNGSSMYISGAPDDRWNNDDLHNLDGVTAADFDVTEMNPIYTSANVPQGAAPSIASFTASSQTVSAGTPVTLSWSVSGASYLIVSPDIGATRGTSVVVTPSQTTTYTLYATNAFGRTTATVTITAQ